MNIPNALTMVPKVKPAEEMHREQSAQEFLQQMAIEIQLWLRERAHSGQDKGMQWILTASLADGRRVIAHQLSAHGHALIKIVGELQDGSSCLLITHQSAVQFLASYIPRTPPEEKKREMGFHAIIGGTKIEQSA
jgi:hypothetical protein